MARCFGEEVIQRADGILSTICELKSSLHLESIEDPPLHQIRLNRLSDPSAYFGHVAGLGMLEAADKEELKQRASKFI